MFENSALIGPLTPGVSGRAQSQTPILFYRVGPYSKERLIGHEKCLIIVPEEDNERSN